MPDSHPEATEQGRARLAAAGPAGQEGTICYQRPSGQLWVREGLAGSESLHSPESSPEGGCAPQPAPLGLPGGAGVTAEPGPAVPAATARLVVAQGHQLQGAGSGPRVCWVQRGTLNERDSE